MNKIDSMMIAILLAFICVIISVFQLPPVQRINFNPMNIAFVIVILVFIYLYERKVIKRDDK